MEWIIKIEKKPTLRIKVKFDPKSELIYFIGQHKTNLNWTDFSEESTPMKTDFVKIQEILFKVYEKLNERFIVYEDLSKTFHEFNVIEIKED